jgi:hypothetical protein
VSAVCDAAVVSLMGHMQNAPDRLIPVGSSVIYRAPADGALTLYVNDVRRCYENNSGAACSRIYECRPADSSDCRPINEGH